MKILKSTIFHLITLLTIIGFSNKLNAQLTTNNGKLFFKNNQQRLQANGTNDLSYYSNHVNQSILSLRNNQDILLGKVLGSVGSTGIKYFGLSDSDGNWSYLIANDSYTAFRINDDNKMIIQRNGRIDLLGTTDASENVNTGVLQIAGALRLDANEIITNKDKPLYLNYSNNGYVIIDETTLIVDASEDCVKIGNVSTANKNYKLYVEKGILTEKVKVAVKNSNQWADYVFEENYDLMSIEELEDYVSENKHLPNVPSAKEVVKEGIDMAQMDATLLEKIEEFTLYVIQQQKEIKEVKDEMFNSKK